MNTLLLDQTTWDLCLDADGNIAMASDPYAPAQDVASAIRLFAGELWYDTTKGVPYFTNILGHAPPLPIFRAYMVAAANTVPGVTGAVCTIGALEDRQLTGDVLFSYRGSGSSLGVAFAGATTTIGLIA